MTEHLILDARESTKNPSGEIDLLRSSEFGLRAEASLDLGNRAVSLLHSLDIDTTITTEHSNTFNDSVRTGSVENMVNNQEGVQNARLFKQKYDAAVESIDYALQGNINELYDKIPTILNNIDELHATPYISSAPEFVAMVKAARSSIEAADSFTELNSEAVNFVFATLLSQARQQLSGTLIAYTPQ